jgi:hypothetical protein
MPVPMYRSHTRCRGVESCACGRKQPKQFCLIGDIINLKGKADTVQETVAPTISVKPPSNGSGREKPATAPSNGSSREKFAYGSRNEKTAKMKQAIIDSITKGRSKFAEMQADFTKRGHKPVQFQGTLETLKKAGYIAAKGRGLYKLTHLANGAAV